MTKIVGTLGPKSRSVEVISGCLKAGMSGNTWLRFLSFLLLLLLLLFIFFEDYCYCYLFWRLCALEVLLCW